MVMKTSNYIAACKGIRVSVARHFFSRMMFFLTVVSATAFASNEVFPVSPKWVDDGRPAKAGEAWYADDPAPEFRAKFTVQKPQVNETALKIACAGLYEIAVNGKVVGTGVSLMPLWSPYDKTVYADTITLPAGLLKPAPEENVISVTLGKGWYDMPPLAFWSWIVFKNALAGGRATFALAINGKELDWEWRNTALVQNSLHLGVVENRTLPEDTEWKPAAVAKGPRGKIVPRLAPPIGVIGTASGKARWLKEGEVQVIDFGVNSSGVPEFVFRNTVKGDRIEIVYGERIYPSGEVNVLTQTAGQIKRGNGGPGAPQIAMQKDVLVCAGGEEERFSPRFTWHACRYAQVSGARTLLQTNEVTMKFVASLVKEVAPGATRKFASEDMNKLHEVCKRTFLANLIGVQSDCPGRERLGYGGDIVATCEAYMLNWDMREFYLKTLQDFADEAADNGWITETAPYVGIADRAYGNRSGPISWALAVPVLMDGILRHYGDRRALDFYPVCKRYIGLLDAKYPDGVIPTCIGDHEALERAPNEVVATAHWHEFVRLSAKFAKMTGNEEDQKRFEAIAAKVADVFKRRWVKNGVVANGSQSAQALALYLGLVPEAEIAAAEKQLLEALKKDEFGPRTGIFTTRYMLMYLSEHGYLDVAERIVARRAFPGWLHMLERGATTLWETWRESDNKFSNNHPMFGSVDEWLLKYGK